MSVIGFKKKKFGLVGGVSSIEVFFGDFMDFKAKMWAISSDTHQLHYIPQHPFII